MLVRPRYCVFVVRLLIVSRRRLRYAARGASTGALQAAPPSLSALLRAGDALSAKIHHPRVAILALRHCQYEVWPLTKRDTRTRDDWAYPSLAGAFQHGTHGYTLLRA